MKKKIVCLISCLLCASCINAGGLRGFSLDNKIVSAFSDYNIYEFDASEQKIKTEHRREHDYVMNKSLNVKFGETLLSDKQFDVDTYQSFTFRPNKLGALYNHSYPIRLNPNQEYQVKGYINKDGKKYYLLDSDLGEFVFLFDEEGNFLDVSGWIEDGNLKLLEEKIFVYPSDIKMQIIPKIREEISNIKDGYEIKYAGAKLDRIWFNYLEYDQDENSGGIFERLNFPNKPGLIMINGKGMRILKADEDSLTYMILKD